MSKVRYFKFEGGSQVSDGKRVINFATNVAGVIDAEDIALCEKAKLEEVDAKTAKEMNAATTEGSFASIEDELGVSEGTEEGSSPKEEKKEVKKDKK